MLKSKKIWRIIIIDVFMLTILSVNMLFIIFDWLFSYNLINIFLKFHFHSFYNAYIPYHFYFWKIDLIFVSIYWVEIFAQWIYHLIFVKNEKWYHYPYKHWYDIIGSIPIGTLHWLRILRVFSIIYRLHKLKLIDITKTFTVRTLNRWIDVLSEEVSDRVVVNILSGVQNEIELGNPVFDKINTEIIKPRIDNLVAISVGKLNDVVQNIHDEYGSELKSYLDEKVENSVNNSKDVKTLSRLPLVGKTINSTLKSAISDIVFDIINQVLLDLRTENKQETIEEIIGLVFNSLLNLNRDNEVLIKSIIDSLEIIKEQVKVQQWKISVLNQNKEKIKSQLNLADDITKKKLQKKLDKIEKEIKEASIQTPFFK